MKFRAYRVTQSFDWGVGSPKHCIGLYIGNKALTLSWHDSWFGTCLEISMIWWRVRIYFKERIRNG